MKTAKTASKTTTIKAAARATNSPRPCHHGHRHDDQRSKHISQPLHAKSPMNQGRRIRPEGDGEHPDHDHERSGISRASSDARARPFPESPAAVLDQTASDGYRIPSWTTLYASSAVRPPARRNDQARREDPQGPPPDRGGESRIPHRADADERARGRSRALDSLETRFRRSRKQNCSACYPGLLETAVRSPGSDPATTKASAGANRCLVRFR